MPQWKYRVWCTLSQQQTDNIYIVHSSIIKNSTWKKQNWALRPSHWKPMANVHFWTALGLIFKPPTSQKPILRANSSMQLKSSLVKKILFQRKRHAPYSHTDLRNLPAAHRTRPVSSPVRWTSRAVPDVLRKPREAAGYTLLVVAIRWILPRAWQPRTFLQRNCSAGSKRLQRGTSNVERCWGTARSLGPSASMAQEADLNADSGERATPEPHQTGRVTPRFLISAPQYVLILLLANEPHVYTLGDLS